eukprot:tig00021070_g17882.t1
MLAKSGCEVETAEDGLQAVEAFAARQEAGRPPYDCILMDCEMPVLDGLGATREIRQIEGTSPAPARAVPIVALTAHELDEKREACLAAGMTDFVTKPVTKAKLLAAVLRAARAQA